MLRRPHILHTKHIKHIHIFIMKEGRSNQYTVELFYFFILLRYGFYGIWLYNLVLFCTLKRWSLSNEVNYFICFRIRIPFLKQGIHYFVTYRFVFFRLWLQKFCNIEQESEYFITNNFMDNLTHTHTFISLTFYRNNC